MEKSAVLLQGIKKMYPMYKRPQDRLKQSLWLGKRRFYQEFWALKGIDLTIPAGRTIGIIGRNGSGKSTLLQILAGTLTPTEGTVCVAGRVAAILELGSGFNPELSGRENVFLYGTLMGLSKREIEDSVEAVEQFADIGDFMEQPVKTYSSGMFVRLAFACAVNVNPDVLIVDEALAVGDTTFQLKCINKMKAFKEAGKTIIYVSHDIYSVRNFCDTAVWMMQGAIHRQGEVQSVTEEYNDYMKSLVECEKATPAAASAAAPAPPRAELVSIGEAFFRARNGSKTAVLGFGEPFSVAVSYEVYKKVCGLVGGIAIYDNQNQYVCGLNTKLDQHAIPEAPGRYRLELSYEHVNLLPGTYWIDVAFFESSGIVLVAHQSRMASFQIRAAGEYRAEGMVLLAHQWNAVEEGEGAEDEV